MDAHHFQNNLSGGAILVNLNGVETLYYSYTDNQGSLVALTDVNCNVVEKYAYDPWGARRNPTDWTQKDARSTFINNRGYTGHEHLDIFNIINMNGRVYDPQTSMFFSPDPFVQAVGDWRNYNRYGYCMNNPTRYTDPTGYKMAEKNSAWFAQGDWNWMSDALGSGGSALKAWDAQHRGSITYNEDDQKYEYANGDEATLGEAFSMYVNNTNSHTYYGSDASTVFNSLKYGDDYTNRALNNIAISNQDALNALPNALSIMVSLSQEFTTANPGEFAITTVNGTQVMMSTDQLIGALELASKFTLIAGIGIEGGIAVLGSGIAQQDAKQNFWSDTMVSISLYTISVAGCGVPALILTVGWIMYRNHAFDGILKQQYYQNNYTPNTITPQDAIPQYPLKDGPQPIYFNH